MINNKKPDLREEIEMKKSAKEEYKRKEEHKRQNSEEEKSKEKQVKKEEKNKMEKYTRNSHKKTLEIQNHKKHYNLRNYLLIIYWAKWQ